MWQWLPLPLFLQCISLAFYRVGVLETWVLVSIPRDPVSDLILNTKALVLVLVLKPYVLSLVLKTLCWQVSYLNKAVVAVRKLVLINYLAFCELNIYVYKCLL